MKCAVFCCPNNRIHTENKSFFRFPQDKVLCKKWLEAIGRMNYIPSKGSNVCEDHFNENDINKNRTRKTLKICAIPLHNFAECADCCSISICEITYKDDSSGDKYVHHFAQMGHEEEAQPQIKKEDISDDDYVFSVNWLVDDVSDTECQHKDAAASTRNTEPLSNMCDERKIMATKQLELLRGVRIKNCMQSSDDEGETSVTKKAPIWHQKLKKLRKVVIKKNKEIKKLQDKIRSMNNKIIMLKSELKSEKREILHKVSATEYQNSDSKMRY